MTNNTDGKNIYRGPYGVHTMWKEGPIYVGVPWGYNETELGLSSQGPTLLWGRVSDNL